MREFLFRGKRKDNGEWVDGGSIFKLINKSGEHFFIPRFNEKVIATHDDNMNIIALEGCILYKVDPETVGQYTGLTDKNGVKIFEGDIIKDDWGKIYTVIFTTKSCSFMVECTVALNEYEKGRYWIGDAWCESISVIGNIHDNPELLKGVE